MTLPPFHSLRRELNDEVHARPPEAFGEPASISYLALMSDWTQREQEWQHVVALAAKYGAALPPAAANHFSIDLGPFRLRYERHLEFARYLFVIPHREGDLFSDPAINRLPPEWVAALPGMVIQATHVALARNDDALDDPDFVSEQYFAKNALAGSIVAGGTGLAFTDFRIHADGFNRILVVDRGMTPRQAGRMVQRLLEIETYRLLALLAFPVARDLSPFLTRCEKEVAEIGDAQVNADPATEPLLLDRLTRLAAELDRSESATDYRFSAAGAYYELVQRRVGELREARIEGLQTFQEFMARRLAPAMNTCRGAAARQKALASRIARATQLLATRVGLTRERQNQALLEAMSRRAKLQLRLQQTVEGFSVAAITYYVVGLVGYTAKGVSSAGVPLNADIVLAASIPIVALLVALGVRRIRRMVSKSERGTP